MAARRMITIRPNAGMWTADPAQGIPDGTSPDMLNFQIFGGYIRKRPGYGRYQTGSSFPAAPIVGIASAQATSGGRALYAINLTGVFKYNTGTTNWDAQTGPALTGAAGQLFSIEVSQNCLVFSQGVDKVMSLPLGGSTYAILNTNCPPAFWLTRWNQRLYLGFTVESGSNAPFRVRWSINGDHTDWVDVGSGFDDLNDDVYQVRNVKKILDTLAVYTERGIILANKTSSALGPAQFALQVKDVGLFASNTLMAYNVTHFFLGTDNMYLFNGAQVVPIANAVRSYLFNQLNAGQFAQYFGALFLDTQEYGCFVCTGANTACDTAWMYNWQRNAIYPWQFQKSEFTCATTHYLDSSVTIGALAGTIASQTWVIGSHSLSAGWPLVVLGDNDGHIHYFANGILNDDGAPILCRWTSKDYTAGDIDPQLANYQVKLRGVGVSYVDPGTTFTLQFYYSINNGTTWLGPYPLTCGGVGPGVINDQMLTQQITGKRVRFKFENNTTNENPQIIALYPVLEQDMQMIA